MYAGFTTLQAKSEIDVFGNIYNMDSSSGQAYIVRTNRNKRSSIYATYSSILAPSVLLSDPNINEFTPFISISIDKAHNMLYILLSPNGPEYAVVSINTVTNSVNTYTSFGLTYSSLNPTDMVVDSSGTLYFCITSTSSIVKYNPLTDSSVVPFAGSNTNGYIDGTNLSAQFNNPMQLDIGTNGALYVADHGNSAIRKIYNGQVTTLYISPSPVFYSFSQVSVGPGNNIYTTINKRTISIISQLGAITTYTIPSVGYSLAIVPVTQSIKVDSSSNIFITDPYTSTLYKYTLTTSYMQLSLMAQGATGSTGPKGDTGTSFTWKGAYDSTGAYNKNDVFYDSGSSYLVTGQIIPSTSSLYAGVFGSSDFVNGPLGTAKIYNPYGKITMDTNFNLYFIDTDSSSFYYVRIVFPTGEIMTYAGYNQSSNPLIRLDYNRPIISICVTNGRLFILMKPQHDYIIIAINVYSNQYQYTYSPSNFNEYSFPDVSDISGGPDSTLYITEKSTSTIWSYRPNFDNDLVQFAGSNTQGYVNSNVDPLLAKFNNPEQVVVGSDGAIYVADHGNSAIRKIFNGTVTTLYKSNTYMSKGYYQLAIDANNMLYTALNAFTLAIISQDGVLRTPRIPTNIQPGIVIDKQSIYVDASSNVFIMNLTNSVIIKYNFADDTQRALMAKNGQGFNWRGVYDSQNIYQPYDVFTVDQSAYIYKGNGFLGYQYTSMTAAFYPPQAQGSASVISMIFNSSGITPPGLSSPSFFFSLTDTPYNGISGAGIYCVDKNSNYALITSQPPNVGSLGVPGSLALDSSGNIYFIDNSTNATYKVNIQSGQTTLIAWDFTGGLYNTRTFEGFIPSGIAADASGNVYVSDVANSQILCFPTVILSGAYIFAGGAGQGYQDGPGLTAKFYNPSGLVLDGSGNLYVADTGNNVIRKIIISTQEVSSFAGSYGDGELDGALFTARFVSPGYISYDNGTFYVTSLQVDNPSNLRKISGGKVSTIIPTSGQSSGFVPMLGFSLTVANSGTIYSYDYIHSYEINYVNTQYELFAGQGATGATGSPGPISPITITIANNLASAQSFTLGDKGNTYIITSSSNAYHGIAMSSLTTSDAGFYVYLRNGNPKTGFTIIIYYNGMPVNDTDDNSVLYSYSATGNASNCILYWSGTGYTLY